MTQTNCGIFAIVGLPNAGKSTLLNALVGSKVSIVSPKVQTTRGRVRGVCITGNTQLVFTDTPGIFDAPRAFEKAMVRAAWGSARESDGVLLLLDASRGIKAEEAELIEKIASQKHATLFAALNQIDRVADKKQLLQLAQELQSRANFTDIFFISALTGDGVKEIAPSLAKHCPPSPWLYPADQLSDLNERMIAAEFTREEIFHLLHQEIPYSVHVETLLFQEEEGLVHIAQEIFVEREGQKKILIGAGGQTLKTIGTRARKQIEAMIGKRVRLDLHVKLAGKWKTSRGAYDFFGLDVS